MPAVAVIGDAMIDHVLRLAPRTPGDDEKRQVASSFRELGGTGANAAAVVSMLGQPVELFTAVPDDVWGDWLVAALLAISSVLGLAVGTLLRRSAGAVTAVIGAIVLPYLLATVPGILPVGAEQWLLRVTPAAGFAVQQTLTQYPQVQTVYTPGTGYFPLAPWAGFAVLCAWAAAALVLALFLLRRRDA